MEKSLATNVFPLIQKGGKYDGQLSVVARLYPQPLYVYLSTALSLGWVVVQEGQKLTRDGSHYFSTFHTEALLIFGSTHPQLFWKYLSAVRFTPFTQAL